jgi:hypothetical protein
MSRELFFTRRAVVAAAAILLSAASAAYPSDYPYSGFYVANFDRVSFDKAQLLCAYGFFSQLKDGSFIDYHLDLAGFMEDQSVKYLEYSRGQCVVDPDRNIETCTTAFDSDPSQQGKTFIDVFRPVGPLVFEVRFFDDMAGARAFVRDGTVADDNPAREFDRCTRFDSAAMADYLSAERSTLSPDERMKLTAPQLDAATTAIMTSVLEAIRAGKKE